MHHALTRTSLLLILSLVTNHCFSMMTTPKLHITFKDRGNKANTVIEKALLVERLNKQPLLLAPLLLAPRPKKPLVVVLLEKNLFDFLPFPNEIREQIINLLSFDDLFRLKQIRKDFNEMLSFRNEYTWDLMHNNLDTIVDRQKNDDQCFLRALTFAYNKKDIRKNIHSISRKIPHNDVFCYYHRILYRFYAVAQNKPLNDTYSSFFNDDKSDNTMLADIALLCEGKPSTKVYPKKFLAKLLNLICYTGDSFIITNILKNDFSDDEICKSMSITIYRGFTHVIPLIYKQLADKKRLFFTDSLCDRAMMQDTNNAKTIGLFAALIKCSSNDGILNIKNEQNQTYLDVLLKKNAQLLENDNPDNVDMTFIDIVRKYGGLTTKELKDQQTQGRCSIF